MFRILNKCNFLDSFFYLLLFTTSLVLIIPLFILLVTDVPANPWEAGIIMDTVRMFNNLSVYEDFTTGHATHMYGVLFNYYNYLGMMLFGINNNSVGILNMIVFLFSIISVSLILNKDKNIINILLCVLILLSINSRTLNFIVSIRPDIVSMILGALSVLFFYKGKKENSIKIFNYGLIILVLSFLIKQQGALFSLIPLLLIVFPNKSFYKRLYFSLAPILLIFLIIILIKILSPNLYFYMITAPGYYSISVKRFIKGIIIVLLTSPLFLFAYCNYIINRNKYVLFDYLIDVSLLVTIVFSSISFAKVGGGYNSFLPFFIITNLFICWWILNCYFYENSNNKNLKRIVIIFLIFLSSFNVFNFNLTNVVKTEKFQNEYNQIINMAKELEGKVISPEDPTIAYYGNGYIGRSIEWEQNSYLPFGFDDNNLPPYLVNYLKGSDYIIDVDWYINILNDQSLEKFGCSIIENNSLELYKIWKC